MYRENVRRLHPLDDYERALLDDPDAGRPSMLGNPLFWLVMAGCGCLWAWALWYTWPMWGWG